MATIGDYQVCSCSLPYHECCGRSVLQNLCGGFGGYRLPRIVWWPEYQFTSDSTTTVASSDPVKRRRYRRIEKRNKR